MYMSIFCIILIALTQSKVVIQNLDDNFVPENELDYVNYLKLILGRQDESTKLSETLTQIAADNRYSLSNSVQRVVLAFIPHSSKEDIQKQHVAEIGKAIDFKGKLLQELVFETPQLFIITSLPANEEARLHQLIEVYRKESKVVHVIRGDAKEVRKLGDMLNMEAPEYQDRIHHPNRRLDAVSQTAATPDSTYLIKFFFSLLFILVIVGTLGFIAQNDGKKDTLLYAKFIADVGAR